MVQVRLTENAPVLRGGFAAPAKAGGEPAYAKATAGKQPAPRKRGGEPTA